MEFHGDDEIVDIDQLSLRGRRVLRNLSGERRVTVQGLASVTEFDILMQPNTGMKTLKEIRNLAAVYGIVLSRRTVSGPPLCPT